MRLVSGLLVGGIWAFLVLGCNGAGEETGEQLAPVSPGNPSCPSSPVQAPVLGRVLGDHAQLEAPGSRPVAAALAPDGTTIVAGAFRGTLDLGSSSLESAGGTDVFVLALEQTGAVRWARRMGGAGDERFYGLAVGGLGGIYVAGGLTEAADFGTGELGPGPESFDAVVLAKLDPAGASVWSRVYTGGELSVATDIAADAEDGVVIGGNFEGRNFDLGGGPVGVHGFGYLARIDAEGETQFVHLLRGSTDQEILDIAAGAPGEAVAVGWMERIAIDGGDEVKGAGLTDGYMASFGGSSGDLRWLEAFGTSEDEEAVAVALDANGGVVIAGRHGEALDLGNGATLPAASGMSAFWARIDRETGAAVRAHALPFTPHLGADAAGGILLAGDFEGNAEIGGSAFTSEGGKDAVVVRVDDQDVVRWSRQLGGAGDVTVNGLAVDGCGRSALTGTFTGELDLGNGRVLEAGAGGSVFVATYVP